MYKKLMQLVVIALSITGLVACAAPAGSTGTSSSGSTSTTVTNTVATTGTTSAGGGSVTLTLGAYTTPREAYGEIIPIFQAAWKAKTGQDVKFEESYLGSGAQARAIVQGFEAD
ncbi:MAG: sulfate ABC transporter substrate-binding protein, partial [Chloroflexi bacterium]|nr:sulfate ABC transporter substrate-binding protein [Chloroflexota bacterium]